MPVACGRLKAVMSPLLAGDDRRVGSALVENCEFRVASVELVRVGIRVSARADARPTGVSEPDPAAAQSRLPAGNRLGDDGH
jgi:hypothetical protein